MPFTLNMADDEGAEDPRVERAVKFLLNCPKSSIPQAMRAVKFTEKEVKNPTTQMQVRRRLKKAKTAQQKGSASPPSVLRAMRISPSRPTTTDNANLPNAHVVRAAIEAATSNIKQIRATSSQSVQKTVNKKASNKVKTMAFKKATRMLAIEQMKTKGMGVRKIVRLIKEEYGVTFDRRTIEKM